MLIAFALISSLVRQANSQLHVACLLDSVSMAEASLGRGANPNTGEPEGNPKLLSLLIKHGRSLAPKRGYSYAHNLVDEFSKTNDPWEYGGGRPISGPGSKKIRPANEAFFECLRIYRQAGGTLLSRMEYDHPMGYGRKGWTPLDMARYYGDVNDGEKLKHMKPMVEVLERLTKEEINEGRTQGRNEPAILDAE